MIVASRSLKLHRGDSDVAVAVKVFAPQAERNAWTCRYEIDWPEGTRKFASAGHDAMQALLLALSMIGAELYTSDYHKSKNLMWDEPGRGYGFPVPNNLRDLLEGD